MRIDAIGLPVDRLQLRPESLRQSVRPFSVPLTQALATPPVARPEPVRPSHGQSVHNTPGAAAAQAAVEASASQARRAPATPGSLIEQLRKQRLSLGRMLGDVNRRLAEPVTQQGN